MRASFAFDATDRWLMQATVGLSLCFACMEYERYTALWSFGTRSASELAFIMLSLSAVLAVAFAFAQQTGRKLYAEKPVLAGIALVQTFGLLMRIFQASGMVLPSWAAISGSIFMQAAGVLFVIYAQFFLEVGVKKSVRAFARALVAAGAIQVICAWLPAKIAFFVLPLFAPASCVLLVVSQIQRNEASVLSEREDLAAERESTDNYARAFPFWQCCMSIALINVLLLALHNRATALQDGGELSLALQISSGLGSLLAGALFLFILSYLQELEFVELLRALVLPLVLAALYASTLFGEGASVLYLVPLGMGYTILLLLVWTVPRYYPHNNLSLAYTCIAFFAYKAGWAVGIAGIMIAPAYFGEMARTAVMLVAFALLMVLASLHLVHHLRIHSASSGSDARISPSSDESFHRACQAIADRYGLTPREREVLPLLAKGRNARHVAKALVVSDGTARTHIMHIYQKMEIKSQQALMDCVDEEMEPA